VRFGRVWPRSHKANGEAAWKHGWKWNCKHVSGRILSIDAAVADRWGLLAANAKIRGKPLSTIDGLLAATAIHHNLTIVSRNVGDFTNTRVPVVNPLDHEVNWQAQLLMWPLIPTRNSIGARLTMSQFFR